MNIRSALRSLIIVMPLLFCATAQGQPAFPSKPVRIITAAVGGASDFTARMLAQGLGASLGQQFIVDNRGGANGIIAAQMVAKSPPDGYNLLLFTSPIWLLPLLQDNVPYDPVRDFAPIAVTDSSPSVLVVHPSLPVKSVRDLIALAKARPGELNYTSGGNGSPGHLIAEMFKSMTATNLVHVPYKTVGQAVTGLIAGQAQVMFTVGPSAVPQIQSGRIRGIAVTTLKRSKSLPDLPTVAESGLPGFEAPAWNGVLAPAGTPNAIVMKLHGEIMKNLRQQEFLDKIAVLGFEPVGSTPAEFGDFVKAELAKWAKVAKDSGAKAE
jgi:tripartite-type tricarboxylate transporter receptor subunit TctC